MCKEKPLSTRLIDVVDKLNEIKCMVGFMSHACIAINSFDGGG